MPIDNILLFCGDTSDPMGHRISINPKILKYSFKKLRLP
jgi:hypothetical protein